MEICIQIPHDLVNNENLKSLNSVDAVYLGEIYCSRKINLDELIKKIQIIKNHGKRVYLSTPVIPSDKFSIKIIKKYFELVENDMADAVSVNDLGALELGLRSDSNIFVGPYLDTRNINSAKIFERFKNVKRISLPYDLPIGDIKEIIENTNFGIETQIHGSIPLLVSGRCFLKRASGLSDPEDCGMLCRNYPDGMDISTLDSELSFIIAGKVIYGGKDYCLLEHLDKIKDLKLSAVRMEEWNKIHPDIYKIYKEGIDGKMNTAIENTENLCNGWFFGKEGYKYIK